MGEQQRAQVLRPHVDSAAAGWFMSQLFRTPPLAHHPTCRCYDNHLIRFGSVALCLGCTCAAAGSLIGAAAILALSVWHPQLIGVLGCPGLVAIGVACYLPSLVQPFLQRRHFKIISRTLLGTAVVLLWFGAMVLLPWTAAGLALRGVFVLVFWSTYRLTQAARRRWTPSPCRTCPTGAFPFCQRSPEELALLLPELRGRACPEDHMFVDFVSALAEQGTPGDLEIIEARQLLSRCGRLHKDEPAGESYRLAAWQSDEGVAGG